MMPMDDYDADSLAAHLFTTHGDEGGYEGATLDDLRMRHARAHLRVAEPGHEHPPSKEEGPFETFEGEPTEDWRKREERLAAVREHIDAGRVHVEPDDSVIEDEIRRGQRASARTSEEWYKDFLDLPIEKRTTPISRLTSQRFIPDVNLQLTSDPDFLLSEEVRGMRLSLEAKVLRSEQAEQVLWTHTTRTVDSVWAAVCAYWLVPIFTVLWEALDWEWLARVLAWADDHYTVRTETFEREVPVRWCPHVPIPERDRWQTHLEWVTHGEPASIAECKRVLRDVIDYTERPSGTIEETYERMMRRTRGHLFNLEREWGS